MCMLVEALGVSVDCVLHSQVYLCLYSGVALMLTVHCHDVQELEGEISKELDQARQYFTNYEQFEQQAKAGPLKWLPFKIKGVN